MDNLPSDVLTTVFNYLPWRDRLATRQLSSKFRSIPSTPIFIAIFTMKESQNSFSFSLKFERQWLESRIIKLINSEQDTDFLFTSSKMEDEISLYKTTIRCASMRYHHTIGIYLNFFISHFFLKSIQLIHLSSHYLAIFRQTLHQILPDIDWQKERRWLELITLNNVMLEEERKLLNYCKNPHLFRYRIPVDFTAPADFWDIPAIRKSSQLFIDYGEDFNGNNRVGDIDLGVTDEFIRKLTEERKFSLGLYTSTKVTIDYLFEYIEGAFRGGYVMFFLRFFHFFNTQEVVMIRDWLIVHGFKKIGGKKFAFNLDKGTVAGYHPDRLVVWLTPTFIEILGDYAEFRGRQTIMDPEHPFNS